MLRNIKYIVVHCTATQPEATIEALENYWKNVKGWGDTPGYHYLIKRDGEIENLLDENQLSYGVYGHNANCVHLAYIGGIDKDGNPLDNRTYRQKEVMFSLIVKLSVKYPNAEILGHRDFPGVAKACPSFDVKSWITGYNPDLKLNTAV
jgi:N-acetylmuramoyl-L-alanine amidase